MNTENHLKTASSKEPYTAPAIEIIPLETSEPVMQGSFSVPSYGDGSMFLLLRPATVEEMPRPANWKT